MLVINSGLPAEEKSLCEKTVLLIKFGLPEGIFVVVIICPSDET